MKHKLSLLAIFTFILVVGTGCTTLGTQGQSGPEVLAEVEWTFEDAAATIVPALLLDRPQDRPQYESILLDLESMAESTNGTAADLTRLLTPVLEKELNSPNAVLALAGAKFVIRRAGRNIAVQQPDVVRAAARGGARGLREALASVPTRAPAPRKTGTRAKG